MGVSVAVADGHIKKWVKQLAATNRPYRQNWPVRLFRHEPVENAAQILRSGALLSRDASTNIRRRDIAPEAIINSRIAAHEHVRLYFRPKNPTQYRIEGIAKPTEYYLGDARYHAPILVIFVFDAQSLLTRASTQFSNGNMQSQGTRYGADNAFFQSIPFESVFHEGSFDPTTREGLEILRSRCAEVLVPSPLQLNGTLQAVLCRSPAERATLLYNLGDLASNWTQRIRVYSEPGLFESRYTYVDTLDVNERGVAFTLHPRRDGATVEAEVEVRDLRNRVVVRSTPVQLSPATRWIVRHAFPTGEYLARVNLERCLAYEAKLLIDDLPF